MGVELQLKQRGKAVFCVRFFVLLFCFDFVLFLNVVIEHKCIDVLKESLYHIQI